MRSILLALILGVATAAAEGVGPPELRRIELTDGTYVDAVGEPERRGGVVVFRSTSGLLVSLPAERVAAVGPAPPPAPRASRPVSDRDRESARSGDVVPTFTDGDLPSGAMPTIVRGRDAVENDAGGEPGIGADELTYSTYRDRNGHGEAWWRERVDAVEAAGREADADLERWSRSYRELSALVELECGTRRRTGQYATSTCLEYLRSKAAAAERLEDARARREAIDRERAGLKDEARRAGALPGWLR